MFGGAFCIVQGVFRFCVKSEYFLFSLQTSEELRLAEDNSALEERLKHLENERRKRDGIEEDYRNIKDQVNVSLKIFM